MYLANHADAVGDDWRRITLNDPDSDPADAVGRASSNTGRSFLNPAAAVTCRLLLQRSSATRPCRFRRASFDAPVDAAAPAVAGTPHSVRGHMNRDRTE